MSIGSSQEKNKGGSWCGLVTFVTLLFRQTFSSTTWTVRQRLWCHPTCWRYINKIIIIIIIKCITGVKNWGKIGERVMAFWPLTNSIPNYGAKFHQNRVLIASFATVGKVTDRHTDAGDLGDFIICPMLCYSNSSGTDKTRSAWQSPTWGRLTPQVRVESQFR